MFRFGSWGKTPKRSALALGLTLLLPALASGQSWVWTTESVDTSGIATSLAVDQYGNLNISYGNNSGLNYGFRSVNESQWFKMLIDSHGVNYTNLKLDRQGNPHICVTHGMLPLRYTHFDGKKWILDEIGTDSTGIEFACAVAIGPNGTPHLTWYKLAPPNFAHVRYAVLRDGAWMTQTVDFDAQTGKWNSMILDSQGNPYISYDAYIKGIMKYAHWDGNRWQVRAVDSRGQHGSDYNIGMGSSLVLDSQDNVRITYYTTSELRYARRENQTWIVQTVDSVSDHGSFQYRSALVIDKNGFPHISYEDLGAVKHAYWDGKQWRMQVISPRGSDPYRYSSMAMDSNRDILYICYQDANDGALTLAIGQKVQEPEATATALKKEYKK